MPNPTPAWSDSCAADPVPAPDDDGPWCTSGLLPEQRGRVTDVPLTSQEEYL